MTQLILSKNMTSTSLSSSSDNRLTSGRKSGKSSILREQKAKSKKTNKSHTNFIPTCCSEHFCCLTRNKTVKCTQSGSTDNSKSMSKIAPCERHGYATCRSTRSNYLTLIFFMFSLLTWLSSRLHLDLTHVRS